jgi:hypothetical protein
MGQSKKGLSKIAEAVPMSGSNKDIAAVAINSADLTSPETVNRMAGAVFGGQTPGTFSAQKAPNRYTQQGAYGVQIPEG